MGLKERIAKLGNNLKGVIQSIIDPKQMRELARKTGFIQRCSSRLDGDEFVQLLIIESVDGKKNTLRSGIDTLTTLKDKAKMTTQALSQRINTKAAANLMEGVFNKTLQIIMDQLNRILATGKENLELLKFFSNVYLQDSTECLLDEALEDEYKGSGGGSGNGIGDASVKVDLIYEYKKKILSYFKITDRREPDVISGKRIVEIIKRGDLVIRDLGYSCINVFQQIHDIGAFFLSRLQARMSVYLDLEDTQPVSLGSFLEKKSKKSGIVDMMVYISKQMLHCRMIAYRVAPEIAKDRRDEYLKECKKKKRKPNKEYIKRLSFTIFITNVPVTMWSATVIGTIYRLRWQVELIFKSWKSNLKFDFLVGTNVFRITCLIYARLTAILIMFTVYACLDRVTLERLEKEVSIHKIIDWLTKHGRFLGIVIKGFCKSLWKSLVSNSKDILCKEKRKGRNTTREHIKQATPFGVVLC